VGEQQKARQYKSAQEGDESSKSKASQLFWFDIHSRVQ
jgi:hypothetical protein